MQLEALAVGPAAAVLVGALLLLCLLLLFRRRSASAAPARSRARETDQASDPASDPAIDPAEPPTPEEVPAEEVREEEVPAEEVTERHLSPSLLAAYVRTLEATLAEQDQRLHELSRAAEQQLAETRLRYAQRVQCTLLAMRERVADQPGDVVMNRVEAALARLAHSSRSARPLLSAEPSGSVPVAFAAVQDRPGADSLPEQVAQRPPAALEPDPMDHEPMDHEPMDHEPVDLEPVGTDPVGTAHDDPAPDLAELDTTVTLHRVLPVPAPVQAAVSSRSRRRFGRSPVS